MKATDDVARAGDRGDDEADSEDEVIATVVHLVNSGTVRLCGNFRGARIDLTAFRRPTAFSV